MAKEPKVELLIRDGKMALAVRTKYWYDTTFIDFTPETEQDCILTLFKTIVKGMEDATNKPSNGIDLTFTTYKKSDI